MHNSWVFPTEERPKGGDNTPTPCNNKKRGGKKERKKKKEKKEEEESVLSVGIC